MIRQWDREIEEQQAKVMSLAEWDHEVDDPDGENNIDVAERLGFNTFLKKRDTPIVGQFNAIPMGPKVDKDPRPESEVDFSQPAERRKEQWSGIEPQGGRNLFSVLNADWINGWTGVGGVAAVLIDSILYVLLPFIGGMMGIATFIAFESDKLTFHHAGLDQSTLY